MIFHGAMVGILFLQMSTMESISVEYILTKIWLDNIKVFLLAKIISYIWQLTGINVLTVSFQTLTSYFHLHQLRQHNIFNLILRLYDYLCKYQEEEIPFSMNMKF